MLYISANLCRGVAEWIPTQNLFWNYMLFKMRDFLRKITKHDILGNKERGFPHDF